MDSLAFISSMVQALAWPTVVLLIVVLLKEPIASALRRVTRIGGKGFEAEFGTDISRVRDEVKRLPPPPTGKPLGPPTGKPLPPPPGYRAQFERLADLSPRGAIMEAWREVEMTLQAIAVHAGISGLDPNLPPPVVAQSLTAQEIIDEPTRVVFEELRQLRNRAAHAHDFQPSTEQAKAFVNLSLDLAERLRSRT